MIARTYYPSPLLSPYVNFFWIFERENAKIFEPVRIVPTGCIEMMIQFGDRLKTIKKNQITEQPKLVLSGQSTEYYDVMQTGTTSFLSVLFKPHAASLFFDMSFSELINSSIDLSQVLKNEDKFIFEKLSEAKTSDDKIIVIEKFLLGLINDNNLYNFKRLSKSIDLINSFWGDTRVSQLSDVACLSDKQFCRVFNQHVGLSPKKFIKIVRLQASFFYMQRQKNLNITKLAYLCGYYDQAHFIKDFRELTGYTPKRFFEKEGVVSDYFISA